MVDYSGEDNIVEGGAIVLRRKVRAGIWVPVVLVFAFAAGYTVWNFSQKPEVYDNEIIQNQEFRIKNQANESEGWKTYRNEEYGFEMKYPKAFELYKKLDRVVIENLSPQGYQIQIIKRDIGDQLNLENWILRDWFNDQSSVSLDKSPLVGISEGSSQKSEITVSGIESIKLISIGELGYQISVFVPVKSKNGIFVLNFFGSDIVQAENFQSNIQEINQVLSTFKFIE